MPKIFATELQCRKNFVGEHFCAVFQKISGSENIMDEEGGQDFPSNIFLSQSAEKVRRGKLLCCV